MSILCHIDNRLSTVFHAHNTFSIASSLPAMSCSHSRLPPLARVIPLQQISPCAHAAWMACEQPGSAGSVWRQTRDARLAEQGKTRTRTRTRTASAEVSLCLDAAVLIPHLAAFAGAMAPQRLPRAVVAGA